MRKLLILISFLSVYLSIMAQGEAGSVTFLDKYNPPKNYTGNIALARVVDGDTMLVMYLPAVDIYGTIVFKNRRQAKKYGKLVKNVKKAYPFARLAGEKLEEYSLILAGATTQKEKKIIMKQAEADLKKEYGKDLRKLTITQGRILIKLIDRETGDTSYELVEDLRGSFVAFFWQSLARIFGHNLKANYDPEGEDKQIEQIVQMIEAGTL